ncbi:hypothetical protein PHLGIDRAFT_296936 [Phlebiopsis gigantea 11061_1 CR5-6]|uniref:Uncharacterized protein n=1 Tax=Phlebiopsis gigantea (strain 11061_1 CR5-6) TaxID=745531 RepID=A0A0C3S3H1_PHLG1|nr:hypothetical protein PHLGIDRAFT_296936 [Phlebiopsis gigantea 11061_1 CR5-6]
MAIRRRLPTKYGPRTSYASSAVGPSTVRAQLSLVICSWFTTADLLGSSGTASPTAFASVEAQVQSYLDSNSHSRPVPDREKKRGVWRSLSPYAHAPRPRPTRRAPAVPVRPWWHTASAGASCDTSRRPGVLIRTRDGVHRHAGAPSSTTANKVRWAHPCGPVSSVRL